MSEMLEIDGSILEGGGQILRISISLSAILGVPVKVTNIRAGRKKPGLAAQHLKGIELVAQICQAKLNGASIGSTEIEFVPGKARGGRYVADTKTAGSISLLLQVSLPVALMADDTVLLELKGGTNADMAPQFEFMVHVFRKMINMFGADFSYDVFRKGYYPKGGGEVSVDITPVHHLRSVELTEAGHPVKIGGWSYVAGVLPVKMAHEMSAGAREELKQVCSNINIQSFKEDRDMAPDNGSGIILTCELSSSCILGSDGLGKREVNSFALGKNVGEEMRKEIESGTCVDCHTQDQLIIYMALADGKSTVRAGEITLHTKTAIHIVEILTQAKFNIYPDGKNYIIECNGIGFLNKNLATD